MFSKQALGSAWFWYLKPLVFREQATIKVQKSLHFLSLHFSRVMCWNSGDFGLQLSDFVSYLKFHRSQLLRTCNLFAKRLKGLILSIFEHLDCIKRLKGLILSVLEHLDCISLWAWVTVYFSVGCTPYPFTTYQVRGWEMPFESKPPKRPRILNKTRKFASFSKSIPTEICKIASATYSKLHGNHRTFLIKRLMFCSTE